MERFEMSILPFTWEGWDQADNLIFSYYNVSWISDFGIFKKGDSFSSLTVDFDNGLVEAYDSTGTKVVKTQKWKASPNER